MVLLSTSLIEERDRHLAKRSHRASLTPLPPVTRTNLLDVSVEQLSLQVEHANVLWLGGPSPLLPIPSS